MKKKPSYSSCAVVTGAGGGIGRSFAEEIAKRGGRVICADVNSVSANETAKKICSLFGDDAAAPFVCDVSRKEDVDCLARYAEDWFGCPASLIINNAGVGAGGAALEDTSMEDWQWVLGINLWGVIYGCQAFLPQIKKSDHGGIINVCSMASFASAPKMAPYNASKAAVLSITETLAAELSGSEVKVSALCPAWVKTNIAQEGRISGDASKNAEKLMKWVGVNPGKIAVYALDAMDNGKLYVLPQIDGRVVWRLKRYAPDYYKKSVGILNGLF